MSDLSFKFRDVTITANSDLVAGMVLAHVNAVNLTPCVAKSNTPELGQIWERQGGIYAGIIRGDDGLSYHLIVSTQELRGEWGNYGKEIEGADSRNDGLPNTNAMATAGSQLAKDALAVSADDHTDFYLPAQCELNLCFANAREHFSKTWHWSSTQFSSFYAWGQNFDDDGQNLGNKSSAQRARAVRRFLVNSVL